jgi:hypothetical protein
MAVRGAGRRAGERKSVITKKRCTFMIETDVLEKLQSITARTGLSKSEQIRQGIRWWLDSREWPPKDPRAESGGSPQEMRPAAERPRAPRKPRR